MKNLFALFVFVCFVGSAFAQITEAKMPMSQGNNNAISIDIPGYEAKDLDKSWTKFLKKYDSKTKKDKKSGEFFSDDAEIKSMSENTIDIYSKFVQKGEDCQLMVWYDLGGAYVSAATHPDQYAAAEEMLKEFQLNMKIEAVKNVLKEEESKLKKLNKENESLKKDKEGYEGDIEKYEKKIVEAKEKIEQNVKDQAAKVSDIEAQQKMVKEVEEKLSKLEKN